MPSAPIKRCTPQQILNRHEAGQVNCEALYTYRGKGLGTHDITIYLQAGTTTQEGVFVAGRPPVEVPRASRMLSDLLPLIYTHASIVVEYYFGRTGFSSEEKLTRTEFVIQTLDVWERFLANSNTVTDAGKKAHDNLIQAMECLKATYTIQELLPIGISLDGFKKYFDPGQENSDGTISN